MTTDELRAKALELAPAGCAMSAAVLQLIADNARLRGECDAARALHESLGERCLIRAGIITRMVERKYPEALT